MPRPESPKSDLRPEQALLQQQLEDDSKLDRGYLALLVGAALMASVGLEQNSAATIIGAMVVAPLMLPIRALGYGLLRFDSSVVQPVRAIVMSVLIIIPISALVGVAANRPEFGSEILSRLDVTFLAFVVAIVGGTLSALSKVSFSPKLTDSLIGVGISVSLVPPLCTVGICLVAREWVYAWNAFLLFFTNLVGISMACMVVFWISGYDTKVRWRALCGLGVFFALIASIAPSLYEAGMRAQQRSEAADFISREVRTYVPAALEVESTTISWKDVPPQVTATIRSEKPPTAAQVSRLNESMNAHLRSTYRLIVLADPAILVTPQGASDGHPGL